MRPSKRRILELERALQHEQALVAILERRIVDIRKRLPKAAPLDAGGKPTLTPEPPRKGVVARNADGDLCIKWVPRHKSKWRPYSKWEYDPPI